MQKKGFFTGIIALTCGVTSMTAQVGINTETPTNKGLHIVQGGDTTGLANHGKAFRLEDGNQGTGKVLSSDANGNGTWTTPAAVMTIPIVPIITVQPRAFSWKETTTATTFTGVTSPTNQTPLESAAISVTATGATSYQWYEFIRNGQDKVAAGTSNLAAYTPDGSKLGMKQYYCVVSNAFGTVKSEIAKVAVGCGAMTMEGGWRTFMCYNLGATVTKIADQLADANNLYWNGWFSTTPATAQQGYSGVFGDLYQWGRIPDGHEKRTSENSLAEGPAPDGSYTAFDNAWASGGAEQILPSATDYYGRFIINASTSPFSWSINPTGRNEFLWRTYRYINNDPCAHVTGVDGGNAIWRIPTHSEWGDIWRGGQSASSNPMSSTAVNTANTWVWQNAGTTTNGSYGTPGGYLIKPDGVTTTLFLPAAGSRHHDTGLLKDLGTYGRYWSANAYGNFSHYLVFSINAVYPAYYFYRAYGFSVRCVGEL